MMEALLATPMLQTAAPLIAPMTAMASPMVSLAYPAATPGESLYAQVHRKAIEREEARKAGDYSRGDRIRAELVALGVQLQDKTHTFSLPDGTQGSYDLYAQDSAPQLVPAVPETAAVPVAQSVAAGAPSEFFMQVHRRAVDREEARKKGDYAHADLIRNELSAMGVRLDDTSRAFFMPDGTKGTYDLSQMDSSAQQSVAPSIVPPASSVASGLQFDDVRGKCREREEARKRNDYAMSDQIRDDLKGHGVALDDKSHTFTMPDGMRGSYDLHDPDVAVVPVAPVAAAAPACPVPMVDASAQALAYSQQQAAHAYNAHYQANYAAYNALYQQYYAQQAALMQPLGFAQAGFAPAIMQQPLLGAPMLAPIAAYGAALIPPTSGGPHTISGPVPGSFASISSYCVQREEARKAGDYKLADDMRTKLQLIGVKVEDKKKTFSMPDGRTGSYDLNSADTLAPSGTSFEEIQKYCIEREEIRKAGDFKLADQMRIKLAAIGVKLDDQTHSFTLEDGKTGSYDLGSGSGEPVTKKQRSE